MTTFNQPKTAIVSYDEQAKGWKIVVYPKTFAVERCNSPDEGECFVIHYYDKYGEKQAATYPCKTSGYDIADQCLIAG